MCQASPGRFLGYLPAYLNDRINPPNSSNAVEGQGRDMSVRGKRRKKRGGKGGKKSGSESGGELVSEGPLMAHFGKYLFSLATNFLHAPSQRVQWLVAAGVEHLARCGGDQGERVGCVLSLPQCRACNKLRV